MLAPRSRPTSRSAADEQAPIRPTQHDAVLVEQLVGDIAHHEPPGVAVSRGGDHRVIRSQREPVEHAAGEQQALAARVGGRAADPVGARTILLSDQARGRPSPPRARFALPDPAARRGARCARRCSPRPPIKTRSNAGRPPLRRPRSDAARRRRNAASRGFSRSSRYWRWRQDRAVGVGNPLEPDRGTGVMHSGGPTPRAGPARGRGAPSGPRWRPDRRCARARRAR